MADRHRENPVAAQQSAGSALSHALASFCVGLTREEIDDFRLTNIENVSAAIADIEREQSGRSSFHNLNKIRLFLDGINQYAKVVAKVVAKVAEVFPNTSEIVAFVWASSAAFDQTNVAGLTIKGSNQILPPDRIQLY
jgi:hypothetical protein